MLKVETTKSKKVTIRKQANVSLQERKGNLAVVTCVHFKHSNRLIFTACVIFECT